MPRVSVVMPVWNRADLVGFTVESVLAQTFRDLELVAADDGSTDRTRAVLEDLARRDPRVVALALPHEGKTPAVRAGLARATGSLVAFLDSDDLWDPSLVATLVAALEGTGDDVGMAYAGYRYFSGPGAIDSARFLPSSPRYASGRIHRELVSRNFIIQDAALVKRAALDAAGGFGGDAAGYAVDWDLWLRLARRFEVKCVARELAFVRVHAGNLSHDVIRHLRSFTGVLERELARCVSADEAASLGVPRALAWHRLSLARHLLRAGDREAARAEVELALPDAGTQERALAAVLRAGIERPALARVLRGLEDARDRLRGGVRWGER